MPTATGATGSSPAPMNVFARVIGIITSPRATFESVVAHPTWLVVFLLTVTISAVGAALPMTTDAGKQAAIDQQVSARESIGFQVSDAEYEQIQKTAAFLPYLTAIGVVVGSVVMLLITSGIIFAIFNAAMGGTARFKQVVAVLVHAGIISALGAAFSGAINYARGGVTSATSLGVLLPMLDDRSFAGKLAGSIDFFAIWWIIVAAMGIAVLYRRKTQPIAITLFGIYAAIVIAIAAFTSR